MMKNLSQFASVLVALALTSGGIAEVATAQTSQTDSVAEATVGAPAVEATTTAAPAQEQPTSSGLPMRAPPPRTLHAFWPFFAAFALTWLTITVYYLRLGGRLKKIADDLDRLEGRAPTS